MQNALDSLIPALERGDSDMVMNVIGIADQRLAQALFSVPYYIYSERLVAQRNETRSMSGPPSSWAGYFYEGKPGTFHFHDHCGPIVLSLL